MTSSAPLPVSAHRAVLVVAALGGFASFLYEVAWTRILSLILGGAVQAFSLMLATFLFGLGLGSFVLARRIDRARDLFFFYAVVEGLAGLTSLLLLPLFGELPGLYIRLFPSIAGDYGLRLLIQGGFCFAMLAVPAFLVGITFPVLSAIYAREPERVGRRVGEVYFANTLGGILGALAGGFFLLPAIGMERTCLAAAAMNAVAAAVAAGFISGSSRRRTLVPAALAGAFVLVLLAYPLAWPGPRTPADERRLAPRWSWDPRVLASGAYVYADDFARAPGRLERYLSDRRLLFYREGLDAVVTVHALRRRPGALTLQVNGKTDASNLSDFPTEVLCGALPLLLHPAPERVLVIGLGSGITAGSASRHPSVRQIDAVEIEAAVVDAARLFARDNHDILPAPARGAPGDPRLRLLVADGRHHCAVTPERYDVIIAQPSNPWMSGPSHLFTREHFANLRRVLRPGGIAAQWFQTYGMTPELVRCVIRTFRLEFPHVLAIAYADHPAAVFLFGSERPPAFDAGRLRTLLGDAAVHADLARVGYGSAERILAALAIPPEEIARAVGDGPLNTDDFPVVEFEAPRHLFRESSREVLRAVMAGRASAWLPLEGDGAAAMRATAAPGLIAAHFLLGMDLDAVRIAEESVRDAPDDVGVRAAAATAWLNAAAGAGPRGPRAKALAEAASHWKAVVARVPGEPRALAGLGDVALEAGEFEDAVRRYEEAIAAGASSPALLHRLGIACAGLGRWAEAARAQEEAVDGAPKLWDAYAAWAEACEALGQRDRASEIRRRMKARKAEMR